MPYNTTLANRIRDYLLQFPTLKVKEKKMFRGLTFMVNGKMCISVSGDNPCAVSIRFCRKGLRCCG